MTAPLIYSSAPIKLNSTTLAATDIAVPTGIANQAYQHSGNLFASVDAFSGAIPRVTFKTPLKDALTTIGTGILSLTTFELYAAKFVSYVRSASSVHTKWAATAGCATITGWSVDHHGIALAEVEVVPLSTDGSTYPLTRTDNNAMITLSGEPLLHTLGPISINGSVITGLNQLSVRLGNNIEVRVSDGDLYPRTVALLNGAPSITGTHLDPATLLSTLNLYGVAISSNVVAYWKSFDATTQVVSTANSISATIALGRIMPDNLDEQQNRALSASFSVVPLSASSTHPLVISTSATAPST